MTEANEGESIAAQAEKIGEFQAMNRARHHGLVAEAVHSATQSTVIANRGTELLSAWSIF